MSQPRPLLIPWLRSQIDSETLPGVAWTNRDRTHFRVPWKHGLRQDSSSDDILLMKGWAAATGIQAQGDPSVWKRNFRSALRAKGFVLVDDNKNDPADPHKVFRFPADAPSRPSEPSGACSSAEELSVPVQEVSGDNQVVPCFEDLYTQGEIFFADSSNDPDVLQRYLQELNIQPPMAAEFSACLESTPEHQQQTQLLIGGAQLPQQQPYPVDFGCPVAGASPEHPVCPAVGLCDIHTNVEQFLETMSRTMEGHHLKTQFNVSVFYRGVKVSEHLIPNENGLRLVYRPQLTQPVPDEESGLTLVPLPGTEGMADPTQANLTQRILDKLGAGVEVGVSEAVVYGQRLGESRTFWGLSKYDGSQQPQEVPKLQPNVLYSLKDFIQGIMGFINGQECPSCSLYLFLGEKWPDPQNRPWEKKLVMVEVVFTSMDLLKSMAVAGGASSLQSAELQLSLEQMMELC